MAAIIRAKLQNDWDSFTTAQLFLTPAVMANTVATLVVQTELLPSQTPSSLSPFPSLLPSVEDGEEDGEKGEEEGKESGTVGLTGDMVTSSTPPATVAQNPEHPFQCLDCGKSFKWSSRLAHHQRSHNNERPYRCNLCPKAFKGSSALLYHQRWEVNWFYIWVDMQGHKILNIL